MKDCYSFAPSSTSKPRWRRLAAIVALFLLATLLLGKSYLCHENSRKSGAGKGPDTTVTRPSENDFYYFRSGMWLSDLRTFADACQYVLQADCGNSDGCGGYSAVG